MREPELERDAADEDEECEREYDLAFSGAFADASVVLDDWIFEPTMYAALRLNTQAAEIIMYLDFMRWINIGC